MRFICFHGNGTNAKVFERQTLRIRESLGRDHEYLFINGPLTTGQGVGYESISAGPYYFWGEDLAMLRDFYDGLFRIIAEQGPFDGVVGFSAGGGVAASLLVLDGKEQFARFKCGIFFCAGTPVDPESLRAGSRRELNVSADGILVNVPTAHIWSPNGEIYPGMGQGLPTLCSEEVREEVVHDLGHDVPGSNSSQYLTEAVRAIERTIERARN
ncbi:hypothetical protein GGR52DRAFT_552073 [Hypoxylon sp. FL1284]|nr:hypothetical protein GGR52DRAFT_552073 [Hypoxylon sp. FL1284]